MKQSNKKKLSLLLVAIIFFIISFIFNSIPRDSIIAGGDFYQMLDFSTQLDRYKYAWFNQIGQGVYNPLFTAYPYYLFFSIFNHFLPSGLVASTIMFFFLLSSFLSFYFSASLLLPKLNFINKNFVSLLYSLNPFVISIFTYPWGFTHHFLIYLFLPILIAIFIKNLTANQLSKQWILIFLVINFISIVAYNNTAFFILILFTYSLITIFDFIFSKKIISHKYIKKLFVLYLIPIIIVFPLFIPNILVILEKGPQIFKSQASLGGKNYLYDWIKNTSNTPHNNFLLAMNSHQYPFVSSKFLILFQILSSFYFLGLLFLISKNKKKFSYRNIKNKKFLIVFSTFLIFFFLSIRYFGPFELINKILYQSPLFIFFRSPDKIFITFTFFYILTIAFLLEKINFKKHKILLGFLLICLIFPYLTGIIKYSLKNDYNKFAKKNKPEYSYIVKIPSEYYELAKIINNDTRQTAVLSLPHSIKNSINWSNYPAWNFVGHDILHLLFNKRFISANTYDNSGLENKMIFEDLVTPEVEAAEILDAIKQFGTEYIIYHKDIDRGIFNRSKNFYEKILELEKNGYLLRLMDNIFFTAFSIVQNKIQPLINFENNSIKYKKINPTTYVIELDSSLKGNLEFLQSYDSNWKLSSVQKKKKLCSNGTYKYEGFPTEECVWDKNFFFSFYFFEANFKPKFSSNHKICKNYANCWEIDNYDSENNYLVIYYQHQNIVYWFTFLILLLPPAITFYLLARNNK